jgi:hypothetical protein
MTPVVTRPAPSPSTLANPIVGAVATVLLVSAFIVGARGLELPAQVDRITIRNPHPWVAHVTVAGATADQRLPIGTVPREAERSYKGIVDQGDTWIVTFAYAGQSVDVAVARDDLARADWTVEVPDDLAQRLRQADVFETPPGAG